MPIIVATLELRKDEAEFKASVNWYKLGYNLPTTLKNLHVLTLG